MLRDIATTVLWCLAVYVCVYDWEEEKEGTKVPGSFVGAQDK